MMFKYTFALVLSGMIFMSTVYAFPAQRAFAHTFTGDESASFLALVESIKVELQLVQSNLASNVTMAEQHAAHAHEHLDEHTLEEIEERNERLATDLPAALEDLHDSVGSSTAEQVQTKLQNINNLLAETVTVRVESDQLSNSTIWGLVLANMADGVLKHYDSAYGIKTGEGEHGHDEGNMTGDMEMTSEENMTEGSMEMEEAGGSMSHDNMTMDGNKTLVDMMQYQSAQGMAVRMQELFSEQAELVPANSTELVPELEASFEHLIQAIENREQPNNITVIVHGEVHPNLQKVYNLQIIPEFPLPLLLMIPAIAGIIAASRLSALRR